MRNKIPKTMRNEKQAAFMFRASVVLGPLLAVAGTVYNVIMGERIPPDWQEALKFSGHGGIIPPGEEDLTAREALLVWLLMGVLALGLVNQIALFFYWWASRHVYLFFYVFAVFSLLFFGLSVQLPAEAVLYEFSAVLSGMTISLAYYSPVAARFRRKGEQLA